MIPCFATTAAALAELPTHIGLSLVEAVPAPGVIHLRYRIEKWGTMLNPDVRRVLDGTSLGHLATVLPDGSPHATPVFVGTHDDQLIFFTGPRSRKARNLRRDRRLALSLAPADNPFQPVTIRGRVTEWLEGDHAGDHRPDRDKDPGQPYTRDKELSSP